MAVVRTEVSTQTGKKTAHLENKHIYVIIDVKFASGIKNINLVFTHTPMCVSTVYTGLGKVLSIQC